MMPHPRRRLACFSALAQPTKATAFFFKVEFHLRFSLSSSLLRQPRHPAQRISVDNNGKQLSSSVLICFIAISNTKKKSLRQTSAKCCEGKISSVASFEAFSIARANPGNRDVCSGDDLAGGASIVFSKERLACSP